LKALADKLEVHEEFSHEALEKLYREHAEAAGVGAGKLIHPTRLAVSGVSFGPGLFEMLELLGKNTVVRRMRAAIQWLDSRTAR